MNTDRAYARTLAAQYPQAGKPTEWFEKLYAEAITGWYQDRFGSDSSGST